MDGALILAIDIGTTTVKAAVFDTGGGTLWSGSSAYPTQRPAAGHVEQDPGEWLSRVDATLRELDRNGLARRVRAVGVTSQVNSHVFVDAEGAALARAITWQDTRAGEVAASMDARISANERREWFGAPLGIDASHALARMAWMQRHRPDIWARTAAVLLPKDYVLRHLTGVERSDPMSNIGLVGQDLHYIRGLLDLLPGAAERLPELSDPGISVGAVTLPGGAGPVPVATGIMDAWAGMLGAGMRGDGDAVYLSGTSEVLGVLSTEVSGAPGVLVMPEWAGRRLHVGPTQSGGAAIAWCCALLGTDTAQFEGLVAKASPDRPAPLFLPHLAGERAPIWDADARGVFLGLDSDCGAPTVARAVAQGIALSARLVSDALEASAGRRIDAFFAGGGGFQADAVNQLRADILDRPIRRLAVRDPGLVGAAALAAVAAGLHQTLDAALGEIISYDRDYEPDPRRRGWCEDLVGLYARAYEATRAISHELAKLRTISS